MHQTTKPSMYQPILALFLGLLTSLLLHDLLTAPRIPPSPNAPEDPSYNPQPAAICTPPAQIDERARTIHPNCIQLLSTTETTLHVRITPPSNWFLLSAPRITTLTTHLHRPPHPPIATASHALTNRTDAPPRLLYTASGLSADTDYTLIISALSGVRRLQSCRIPVTTRTHGGNVVQNAGIEEVADAPHTGTNFHPGDPSSPRHWTPYYNGGARRLCGVIGHNGNFLHPHSGRCCMQLGYAPDVFKREDTPQSFFGAHQGMPVDITDGAYIVVAWYTITADLGASRMAEPESARDALAMVVSWRFADGALDDGIVVPLEAGGLEGEWRVVCAMLQIPKGRRVDMVHIFFHRHDHTAGSILVDDVALHVLPEDMTTSPLMRTCFRDTSGGAEVPVREGAGVMVQLEAETIAGGRQLTLAVPLTAERVLRLEAMSRLYGGGPIVAAVLIRTREQAARFRAVWDRKLWLRRHVSVSFYRWRGDGGIPLNALRNRAVRMAKTKFVAMLDVDMTPDTKGFACFRDEGGKYLEGLLGMGEGWVGALTVFMTDVQIRAAGGKGELLGQLGRRVGTWYCGGSQKASRPGRWYGMGMPGEARFAIDYEPYGICRRDKVIWFDERFVGYGFNKIAWAYAADRGGIRFGVLDETFLTHLNHVENGWVSEIEVMGYLQTWRRFLAFAAEVEDGVRRRGVVRYV